MKTKRLAAVLAIVLALACCAGAWGDLIDYGDHRPPFFRGGYRPGAQNFEISLSRKAGRAKVLVFPDLADKDNMSALFMRLTLSGPGIYEYIFRDEDQDQVIVMDGDINTAVTPRDIEQTFAYKDPPEDETAHYTLKVSYIPYIYNFNRFGLKLLTQSDDTTPLTGERQDFSYRITVENVSGDVRIRVGEP